MPTRCCVLDCKSAQNEPKRQTFPFPLSHPKLMEKWIEALKFHQSQLTSGAVIVRRRICINHFTSDDLEKFHRLNGEISCIPLNSYKLKPDAVPSVFPGVPHPPIPNIAKQLSNEVPFYPNPDIYEENFNMEKDPIALSANDFYVCQICEATENLIDISGDDKSHFQDELEKLKGIENNKMDLLQYLCQECGNKLMEISILRSQYVITYRKLIAKITPLEESTTEIRVKEEAMEVATKEGTSGMDPTGEDEATDDISEMEYDDDDDGDLWEKMKKSKLKPDIFRKYPNMKCIVKAFDAANVCRIASLVKRAENSKNSRKYYSVKLKDRGFCCLKCDTILMNRHAVMMHKFSHDPQNTQNTKCNICNEEFCSPASTQRHIRVVHEKRKGLRVWLLRQEIHGTL
uniref:THAP-type domain-containing protein n=1 Tax=Lutzomyia longipalpis TaxID=7200 RepID=A0A1B0CK55_LUTLO